MTEENSDIGSKAEELLDQAADIGRKRVKLLALVKGVLDESRYLRATIDGLHPDVKAYFDEHIIGNDVLKEGNYDQRVQAFKQHTAKILEILAKHYKQPSQEGTQQGYDAISVLRNLAWIDDKQLTDKN